MVELSAEIPDKSFTYAFSGRQDWSRRRSGGMGVLNNLYLLFRGPLKAEDVKQLLQLPELDQFFPKLRFGAQLENGYAITDDPNIMAPGFAHGKNQRVPAVIDGVYQLLYPKTTQDACTLPHKLILGCSECLNEEADPELHCQIKRMYLAQREQRVPVEVTDVLERWKHLKVELGGYAFVNPVYASDSRSFSSRRVSIGHVSFDSVKRNVAIRKDATQSRIQRSQFKTKVCSTCLVKSPCPATRSRWCEGPYDKTQEEYYEHILEVSDIPFTNSQLSYLLQHSGLLDKAIHKKLHYVTFRYRDGLQFMLGNLKTGDEVPMTFKQAKETIEEYGCERTYFGKKLRITKSLKAMLVVMSSFRNSPTVGTSWHKTSYPSRYLLYTPDGFLQHFYYRRSGYIASWRFRAKDLVDVYASHERIPFVSKTGSPLSLRSRTRYDDVKLY